MSVLDTVPWLRPAKHTPQAVISRLREDIRQLETSITGLRKQLADARAAEDRANAKAVRVDEAETYVAAVKQELNELRAFMANATAIDVPAGQRDIDPDDQPTPPIPVMGLWGAPLARPLPAVTHPGHTTWGAAREAADPAV